MNSQPALEFQWLSALGISVVLFLVYGAVYVLIGVLALFLHDRGFGPEMLIISPRTDSIVFGKAPEDLLQDDPALAKLRSIVVVIMAGLLFVAGCFQLTITWFGLRQGQSWALVALALGGFAVLPFWYVALRPYFHPSVHLTLGDMPPFMWFPAMLLLPAFVLGGIGLGG